MHSLVVLYETNVLSLINQRLDNYYQIKTKCYSSYSAPRIQRADSVAELNGAQSMAGHRYASVSLVKYILLVSEASTASYEYVIAAASLWVCGLLGLA